MEFAGDEDEPLILHTHLKMEGQWHIHYAGDRWRAPGHTARVVLQLANEPRDIEIVGHTLGFVEVYPESDYLGRIEHLGPEHPRPGLGDKWRARGGDLAHRSAPGRAIGAALLDQKNVAGIGNEYRAEACFIAGVHPGHRQTRWMWPRLWTSRGQSCGPIGSRSFASPRGTPRRGDDVRFRTH